MTALSEIKPLHQFPDCLGTNVNRHQTALVPIAHAVTAIQYIILLRETELLIHKRVRTTPQDSRLRNHRGIFGFLEFVHKSLHIAVGGVGCRDCQNIAGRNNMNILNKIVGRLLDHDICRD